MQIDFFFDPVCPFCWQTSRWLVKVAPHRDLDIDWRFISLRMINEPAGYEGRADYSRSHSKGLELLRVAAAVRAAGGPVGSLYTEYGRGIWGQPLRHANRWDQIAAFGSAGETEDILRRLGLPADLAGAAGDEGWDTVIREDTEQALERTGRDVGTPIITFDAPSGPSFFGPVISRVPDETGALDLWDGLTMVARADSFAELKRSLREPLDLPLLR